MHNPIELDPAELRRQAAQLLSVTRKVQRLMESIEQAVHSGEWDTVEAILMQKQRCLDELAKLPQLRESYQQNTKTWPQAKREELTTIFQQLENNVRAIAQAEQDVIRLVQTQHQEAAHQLRALAQRRQASRSYSQSDPSQTKSRIDISS